MLEYCIDYDFGGKEINSLTQAKDFDLLPYDQLYDQIEGFVGEEDAKKLGLHKFLEWYLQHRAYKIDTYKSIEEQSQALGLQEEDNFLNISEAINISQKLPKRILTNKNLLKQVDLVKVDWSYIKTLALDVYTDASTQLERILKWCKNKCVSANFTSEFEGGIADHTRCMPNGESIQLCIDYHLRNKHIRLVPLKDENNTNHVRVIQPVFAIPKKDGGLRLVFDGRKSNKLMEPRPFQLPAVQQPVVDDFIWAAKLDLKSAFLAWKVDPQLRRYLCFRGPDGKLYQWLVSVWGTNVAPDHQQTMAELITATVNKMFKGKGKAYVYLDDFLVTSLDEKICNEMLLALRSIITKMGLIIEESKSSQTATQSLEFLGFVISRDMITLQQSKVKKIQELTKQVLQDPRFLDTHSLISKLMSIAQVVVGLRQLTYQLIASLPQELINKTSKQRYFQRLELSEDFRAALRHALKLISEPEASYRLQLQKTTYNVVTDASELQGGIANPDNKSRLTIDYSGKIWEQLQMKKEMPIHILELFSVIVAVSKAPHNCNLRIACDNQTVIFGLPKGGQGNEQLIKMYEKLNATAARRGITLILVYIKSGNNQADYPSRTKCSNFVTTNKQERLKVYQLATKQKATREEVSNYWFKQHQIITPLLQDKQWINSVMRSKKLSLKQSIENFNHASKDWKHVPAEIRSALAHQLVSWAYITQPTEYTQPQSKLINLMEADGWIRSATIKNAANRLISKRLLFNTSMIQGARAGLIRDEPSYEKSQLVRNAKGTPVISLNKKQITVINQPLLNYNKYWDTSFEEIPKNLRYFGPVNSRALRSEPWPTQTPKKGESILEDLSHTYCDDWVQPEQSASKFDGVHTNQDSLDDSTDVSENAEEDDSW